MAVLVRMRGITKRFGPITVLQDVDLEIRSGEVLVLAGENGAGKSTLIKILGGVYTEFDGTIELAGRSVRPRSPAEANDLGVSVIFQELSLVRSMTVADNLFLGRPAARFGFVNERAQQAAAREWLDRLGIGTDVSRRVEDLPIAEQQLIEVAKALARSARVIVMDEPTSALGAPEVEKLFGLIRDLKARGCGLVYITHRMEEISRLADRIAVLRDGRLVGEAPASELPAPKLVQWMVGREMKAQVTRGAVTPGAERLRLERFTVFSGRRDARPAAKDISLTVRAGEIVGVAGLQGAGNSALFWGLFGAWGRRRVAGRALLNGRPLAIQSPAAAIRQGVALLTNDRQGTGLVLSLSVVANATLADLPRLSPGGWRRPRRELAATEKLGAALSLRTSSLHAEAGALSGGNQQKVALAKWLQTAPQVLLLDEPTRGIDVGAKREIYAWMDELASRGVAILLITSEMPELMALSDRIVVMHRGMVTAAFARAEATAERVLAAAMGAVSGDQ
jgi:ABC-type sugar transport system ATPase subunit